jgi:hypothetical protein
MITFENGQPAKQMIKWFLDPNKAPKVIVDGSGTKTQKKEEVKNAAKPVTKPAAKTPKAKAKKTAKK